MNQTTHLQVTEVNPPSPAAKQFPHRRTSSAVRRSVGIVTTTAGALLSFIGRAFAKLFEGCEYREIDRERVRFRACHCAEQFHEGDEACRMDGAPV